MKSEFASRLLAIPCDQMSLDNFDERQKLKNLLHDAEEFISNFKWCQAIHEKYFGLGVGDIVGVFLLHITNESSPEDEWLWVIVGDLPPAYLVIDENTSPQLALKAYIELMRDWTSAVSKGKPVGGLIPVNAPPTPKTARELGSRLDFLEDEILS